MVVKFSIQELYFLYLIFKKYNLYLSFFQFYTLFNIFSKNSIQFNTNRLYIILSFFFLIKTGLINTVSFIIGFNQTSKNLLALNKDVTFCKVIKFWEKFKKLKRPTTDKNFNDYFLNVWEKKLHTYKDLGFLKTLNVVYIIKSKTVNLYQTVISVNKPLLVSPKFSSTSINKFLEVESCKCLEFQFLRKSKVYNKGRYSRCRQNYRTGVYMCMYLSICSIFGLYYWFYKFTFNFTYLWWFFIVFIGSFFFPKIIKYRLYEPTNIFSKFFDFFKWSISLVRSIFF